MEVSAAKRKLANQYIELFPSEAAATLNLAEPRKIVAYLEQQPIENFGQIFQSLTPDVVAEVLDAMKDELFIEVFHSFDPYLAAKFISRLSSSSQQKKLSLLPDDKSRDIREMLSYPHGSAGFLMDTKIITFKPRNTVDEVLNKLRTIGDRKIVNIYVTDASGKLLGKVFIQKVAITSGETRLEDIIEPSDRVLVMSPSEDVLNIFNQGKVINLPVVDLNDNLLGIIRNDALVKANQKDAAEDLMTMFGAGKEERALSSPWLAVRKRLPWLQINLATAFLAASIVGIFEETIAQVTVLAVFLPVVAGQSGNTGSQALAVTMRGLALREIQTTHWWKVARKEAFVGLVNGVAVAFTTSLIVYFWASSYGLALVIGSSMILSMIIAGFAGAVVPIVLKAIGQDPAQSSSIVLTTVTDIVGFFSFLGLTTVLGSALGIL